MTKVVYKYELMVADSQDVKMPIGATILCAQMQRDELCLWAAVDAAAGPVGDRRINVIGTGHGYDGALTGEYISTVQAGPFVWHIFDAGYCA